MMKIRLIVISLGSSLWLVGCEPSEMRPVPLWGGGGGGGGSYTARPAAPAEPMVPPVNMQQTQEPDPYADYEVHGAVKADDCQKMEARFLKEGRKVRLVETVPNPYNQGGGVLQWLCVFDGEDASPTATPFEDDRFPQSEYTYP